MILGEEEKKERNVLFFLKRRRDIREPRITVFFFLKKIYILL